MPNKKITDYNILLTVDPSNDLLEIVDVSESDPNNKNKKITPQNLIAGNKLDQLGEPTDNTNLDVNTSRHGLMKKLSGIVTQFFNGLGQWVQVKDTDLSLQDETTQNATTSRHGFLKKLSGVATQFLNGLGNWEQVKDTDLYLQDETTTNATTSRHGFLPKLSNTGSKYLRDDGTWQTITTEGASLSGNNNFTGNNQFSGNLKISDDWIREPESGTLTSWGSDYALEVTGKNFIELNPPGNRTLVHMTEDGIESGQIVTIQNISSYDITLNETDNILFPGSTNTMVLKQYGSATFRYRATGNFWICIGAYPGV